MSLEKAIKICGYKNKNLARKALANVTTKCPLKIKVALEVVANQ